MSWQAAQMRVRYIQLISTDGQKFYAQIVNGGVGTANPASTDILVTAVHSGNLNVLMSVTFLKIISKTPAKLSARLLLVILSFAIVGSLAQSPEALNYPNVVAFGVFGGTICYSNSVSVKSIVPVTTRTFTFTPATALMYVVCYNNLRLFPFEVTLLGGGLGATTQTSIVVSSVNGKLFVNCDAYCV
uniref:Uncharacterized protein n=1 Tax=Anopheles atroparvus TaxID=41427 RepID=A0A182J8V0_ANOAO